MVTTPTDEVQRPTRTDPSKPFRVGLVGTGYIADFHAYAVQKLESAALTSVCDSSPSAAKAFAAKWNVPGVFGSIESMLESERLDAVHILSPPDSHCLLGKAVLRAGAHVLIEKPMCTSVEEADELLALADSRGLRVGTSHNMLYAAPYRRLREVVRSGILGPLTHVSINHFVELGQIRFGPYDSWMLRQPGNVFLELGPHLISALVDLVGKPDDIQATADREVRLPGGSSVFRRWQVRANVGRITANVEVDLGPGFPQRTINVRGILGSASLDFDLSTCTVDRRTPLSLDFDRFDRSRSSASQLRSQAKKTLADYALSKFKLRHRGSPYQVTFLDTIAAFYSALRSNAPVESGIDGLAGRSVVGLCQQVIQRAGIGPQSAVPRLQYQNVAGIRPTVLVFGATGFFGRDLIRQLLAADFRVRVAVRGSADALEEFDRSHLEVVRQDLRSEGDLANLMDGIEFVYHLVHVTAQTWDDNLRLNIQPAQRIAEACLAAQVKRLVYVSSIDPYYAGSAADTITERTPPDPGIKRRNYYARTKATIEGLLMDMHRIRKLPVVIFRPGIVIGEGGNPFHFGVGMWVSDGVCKVWGAGSNKLPFVLLSDVNAALVRAIQVEGIEGRSYNLVDSPLLTAREYLQELQRIAGMTLSIDYSPIWRFYAIDFLKWIVKVAVRHPDRTRIPSYSDWQSRTQRASFDCSLARAELGWTPAGDRRRLINEGIGGSLKAWLTSCK